MFTTLWFVLPCLVNMRPGLGTKDHVLIDLCHTHSNAQLAAIKKKWEAKVGAKALGS